MSVSLRGLLAVVAAAVACVSAAPAAHANFTICNDFKQSVQVAYASHNGRDWESQGWWTIRPNQCTVLEPGSLTNRFYYLYARSVDGRTFWGGDYFFCTHEPNSFTIVGDVDCGIGFFEIDTGDEATWTQRLTP